MKRSARFVLILAAVMAAGVGGLYHLRQGPVATSAAPAPSGPVIYYQDPDGKPEYSASPRSTADGRAFRAVQASEDISFDEPSRKTAGGDKRILYYRNPMGLPDVSKTPKKDSMGMDYIPVYEGEDDDAGAVKVSPGKLQRIGVATEAAMQRVISVPVRAPGIIQLDERRVSVISVRTEGFVESVEDVTTGSEVAKGQPLLRIYSPAIAAAAADYLASLEFRGGASSNVLGGGRQRLLNYAAPPNLMAEIEKTRKVPLVFTWEAPRDGIVLERNVTDGMRVMPGDVLFRIADHSSVWATVDVPERELAAVTPGQQAVVRVRSYPARTFAGQVALVYPYLNAATRSVRVRIELANKDLVLRPDMYAEAEINTGGDDPVLAVPESAVIDSGSRQTVIVDRGGGRFEPKPVRLGRRGDGYMEVRDGIEHGDMVVTSANFLIDAESNLKAALKGLADAGNAP
ncbi:MAG: efflux RND transporter periplasmic adaptor subunit [Xanthobacteraceae bacterium]|nr:efflux RND transporter periplasmic adaptor subunit [Xanthobacteraceae bacterium]